MDNHFTTEQVEPRFLKKVTITAQGCWQYGGTLGGGGYAQGRVNGKTTYLHRHYYEVYRGEIPTVNEDGVRLVLDHLCRNRACFNPGHLEVVTFKTNIARGEGWVAEVWRTGQCRRGHEINSENSSFKPDGSYRCCLVCRRLLKKGKVESFHGRHGDTNSFGKEN